LRKLYQQSQPLDLWRHYPATRYLRQRGLELALDPPQNLRFCTSLGYWKASGDKPAKVDEFPAILAVIRDPDGHAVGLHRTYVAKDGSGKAPVDPPRKLCPAARPNGYKGAAVRLYSAGEQLAVAEGIETALAVRQVTGRPAWAALSAHAVASVELPPQAHDVLIAADHDQAGLDAADRLADRLTREGRTARVAVPDEPGTDWLDELKEGAA